MSTRAYLEYLNTPLWCATIENREISWHGFSVIRIASGVLL